MLKREAGIFGNFALSCARGVRTVLLKREAGIFGNWVLKRGISLACDGSRWPAEPAGRWLWWGA